MKRALLLAFLAGAGAAAQAGSVGAEGAPLKYPPLAPLPPVAAPLDNPTTMAKAELGRLLFFDGRLSGNGQMPCAMCHQPGLGWGTGAPISMGYPGTVHWRNSQTILNSAYYNKLFWDGAATSLEAQAQAAATGAVAGNGDEAMMEMRLAFVPEYRKAFKQAFGGDWPLLNDAWKAIAAFERTIVSDPKKVPFDRWVKGDKSALTPQQVEGYDLFNGKAGCIACHNGPLASDQKYHRIGVPAAMDFATSELEQITFRWENYQKGAPEEVYRSTKDDLGLYYVTLRPDDIGKWRTPSLRELRYTVPYMHNGAFETLDQVVDFYDRGGGEGSGLAPLGLTAQEKRSLVAFLGSLSMDEPLLVREPKLPETQPLWTEK